jgi:hypothetical protein
MLRRLALDAQVVLQVPHAVDLRAVEHRQHLGRDGRVAEEQEHQHRLDEVGLELGELRVGELGVLPLRRLRTLLALREQQHDAVAQIHPRDESDGEREVDGEDLVIVDA